MRAVVYRQYGTPADLRLEDVPTPEPAADEVLVRVRAASVNSWDWDLLRGRPLIVRLGGWRRPAFPILGADVAGVVEAVGRDVTKFRPGDFVFGDLSASGWGAFAEYVCAREEALSLKPAGMSFEDAAAIPQAAAMARQALYDYGDLQAGQRVLVNGGGGGVGTFAIQICRAAGAEITAVDRGDKLAAMRALGADHVLDYTQQDFTRTGERYDLVIDVASHRSVFAYARALRRGGTYVAIGGSIPRLLAIFLLGPIVGRVQGKRFRVLPARPNHNVDALVRDYEAGRLTPVIERRYPLHEVPDALRHLGGGGARGKLVITV